MSSYYGKCRTNYFAVNDASKFKMLMAACMGDGTVEAFEEKQKDGSTKYGFLCDGRIIGLPYKLVDDEPVITLKMEYAEKDLDNDISWDLFCGALQDLLPHGEAIIITEIGWEKMCYLLGYSRVITKDDCKGVDLED